MSEMERQLTDVLEDLTPSLVAMRRKGWFYVGLVMLAALSAALALVPVFGIGSPGPLIIPVTFGALGGIAVNDWVSRVQQQLVMPHLAQTVQLTYQQDATSFLNGLPNRLLPKVRKRTAEDLISGHIAGREIKLAEVRIERGGRRRRVIFQGVVLRFENALPLPAFFIAPLRQASGWSSMFDLSNLIPVEPVVGRRGEIYSVWLSESGIARQHPALNEVIDILVQIEDGVAQNVSLYSATSTGEEMHIALRHKRDLFRIGGLLAGDAGLTESIKTAFQDLNVPLQVVSRLLEAERQAQQIKET